MSLPSQQSTGRGTDLQSGAAVYCGTAPTGKRSAGPVVRVRGHGTVGTARARALVVPGVSAPQGRTGTDASTSAPNTQLNARTAAPDSRPGGTGNVVEKSGPALWHIAREYSAGDAKAGGAGRGVAIPHGAHPRRPRSESSQERVVRKYISSVTVAAWVK